MGRSHYRSSRVRRCVGDAHLQCARLDVVDRWKCTVMRRVCTLIAPRADAGFRAHSLYIHVRERACVENETKQLCSLQQMTSSPFMCAYTPPQRATYFELTGCVRRAYTHTPHQAHNHHTAVASTRKHGRQVGNNTVCLCVCVYIMCVAMPRMCVHKAARACN